MGGKVQTNMPKEAVIEVEYYPTVAESQGIDKKRHLC